MAWPGYTHAMKPLAWLQHFHVIELLGFPSSYATSATSRATDASKCLNSLISLSLPSIEATEALTSTVLAPTISIPQPIETLGFDSSREHHSRFCSFYGNYRFTRSPQFLSPLFLINRMVVSIPLNRRYCFDYSSFFF